MDKEIRYKSFDNRFNVYFSKIILDNIKLECIKTRDNETGGILIGDYSEDGNCATITSITGPPKDSKKKRYVFKRGINGLVNLLADRWKEFNQYYIGEWHFHPNSSPEPSGIDDIQMKKLLNNKLLKCPEPILIVVGGNQNVGWRLSVHIYTKNDRIPLYIE